MWFLLSKTIWTCFELIFETTVIKVNNLHAWSLLDLANSGGWYVKLVSLILYAYTSVFCSLASGCSVHCDLYKLYCKVLAMNLHVLHHVVHFYHIRHSQKVSWTNKFNSRSAHFHFFYWSISLVISASWNSKVATIHASQLLGGKFTNHSFFGVAWLITKFWGALDAPRLC